MAWQVPLCYVNHMHAHALSYRLQAALSGYVGDDEKTSQFPFWSLLVSGGHTLLVNSASITEHTILASSADIAIGDCLDVREMSVGLDAANPTG